MYVIYCIVIYCMSSYLRAALHYVIQVALYSLGLTKNTLPFMR